MKYNWISLFELLAQTSPYYYLINPAPVARVLNKESSNEDNEESDSTTPLGETKSQD